MRRIFKETRLSELLLAGLLFVSALMPLISELITSPVYALSTDTRSLVGSSNSQLDSQLTYDTTKGVYQFNAAAEQESANPGAAMATKVGTASNTAHDRSPYSLDIPQNFSHGVTYHDTNSGLSFSLIPQFSALDGKTINGHIVFPLGGGSQAIYTLKNNGLKEDIVLPKVTTDTVSLSYKISLPKTLAMRMIPNSGGAIGVYAADPALYGNVQYGSNADKNQVQKIRETAPKTSLVFGIPAPVVKDTRGARIGISEFDLTDSTLTVKASGLRKAEGPITIDPSVVITSTSDFQYGGNNEGMIDFSTSGQINRGGLTGGDGSAWSTTTALSYLIEKQTVVAYNGYLYSIGGDNRSPSANYATISYAAINPSTGAIGAWNTTTNTPQSYSTKASAQAYNGYLYLFGGAPGTGTGVYSIKINSDGTLGANWNTLNSLLTPVTELSTAIYGNYIYTFGGNTSGGSTPINNVYYAAVNGDGTIGQWNNATSLTYARGYIQSFAYNGYVYILGGANSTPAYVADVQYAKINSDGSLGSWILTNSFTNPRYAGVAGVYNGYAYYSGGIGASRYNDLQYAPINSNGSLGTWTTSPNTFTTPRSTTGTLSNGYLYIVGGYNGTADLSDVQFTKIQAAGTISPFATLTNSFSTARALICSVVLNGYLYAIGGSTSDSGSNNVTTVQYTALNASTGNNGTWSSATVLPIAIGSAGCTTYNNYIYVVGGFTGSGSSLATTYYVSQGSAGALNSWTNTSNALPQTLGGRPGVFTYASSSGTNLYVVGGCVAEGNSNCSKVYYSTLSPSTGAPGTWTTSTNNLFYAHQASAYAQVGKYLYGFGGLGSGAGTTDSEYAAINNDGSVGTWTAGGALPSALGYNWGTAVNGCVYSVGGEISGTSVASVFYGCPSATGAITWSTATSLPAATTDIGVTSANGYIYGVGGYTTASVATTQFARVNNGGSGLATGWSTTGTTSSCSGMSTNRSPTAYNGYVYITGAKGSCGDYYAALNGDGTVGTWTAAANQETNTGYNNVNVAVNGYLYSIGGYNGTSNLATSNYSKIGASGAPGVWSAATASLGTARSNSASATYNGYIYVIGGDPGETIVNYAKPTATGNISAWSTGTALPDNRYGATAVAYGGYLYVIGGGTTSTPSNTVVYAPINADGSLGSWVYTSSITGAQYTSATALNGYIYVMGGATASTNSQMAVINSNGSLGPWQQGTVLSANTSVSPQAAFSYNGWMYLLSNGATGVGQDMFYDSPISSINRIGHYSKLIDLGSTSNITSITFTGSIPYSSQTISYRGAPSSTAQFGSSNLSSAITTPAYCGSSSGNIRYLWLSVTLDDSTGGGASGLFPDANNGGSVVQDMTINYNPGHPATTTRLRSGQTLQTGVLSPLDTCSA